MSPLEWVLIALVLAWVGSIVAVAVGVRMLYKRIRRSRALNSTVLRARTRLSWGPRHEVLKLRVRLDETLASGQAAVALAAQNEASRGELPRLFRRIQSEGAALETQLRLMATETDPDVLAEGVPVARRRVDAVAGLVRRLRSVVADGLGGASDDVLATLQSDVDREVTALYAGLEELRSLRRNDALLDPHPHPMRDRPTLDRLSKGKKA